MIRLINNITQNEKFKNNHTILYLLDDRSKRERFS